jgi:ABC-type multidrug transport system fused ATPase/permease subunit
MTRSLTAARWAEATDRRVKFMASVLRHIKAIKLSAYEPPVVKTALALRDHEIYCLRRWIKQILVVSIITNYNVNFLSLITLTTYTLVSLFGSSDEGIPTSKIFTVITAIALISEPLLSLGQRLGSIVSAWASWKRIENFLLCPEKVADVHGSDSGIELDHKSGIEIDLVNADFGVKDKITLLNDMSVRLTSPPLWMVVGRVGSVSTAGRCCYALMTRGNRLCCKHFWENWTSSVVPLDANLDR